MPELPRLHSPEPWIVRRIHKAAEEKRNDRVPEHLYVSSMGRCERNLWAALDGKPTERPFEGQLLVLFELGNVIEKHVIQLLRDADFDVMEQDPRTGRQFSVRGLGGRLSGYMDGKITLGRDLFSQTEAILEIKSAKAKRFRELKKNGYAAWDSGYADQIHIYMGLSGIHTCLVVVYNKDTSEIYTERIKFDPDRFKGLIAKAERILEAETVLPRPAEAKSQDCGFCRWCDRNQWCWGPLADAQFDE